jgi:hypothetical protein
MHIDHTGAQALGASLAQEIVAARAQDLAARKRRLNLERLARPGAQEAEGRIAEAAEEDEHEEPPRHGLDAKA